MVSCVALLAAAGEGLFQGLLGVQQRLNVQHKAWQSSHGTVNGG